MNIFAIQNMVRFRDLESWQSDNLAYENTNGHI